jgi:predicted TIM-barrel fold metal-dependent hydrolase
MDRYLVISSDTHAGPPSEAYRDYVDPQYREAFDLDLETKLALRSIILEAASEEQEKFREDWEEETGDGGKLASYDPTTRDAELDREGIAGEVIFPDADVLGGGASAPFSAGLQSSGELDGELVMAGARAHNRWLAELCSASPERRCGVATVPILHDIDGAVAEIGRIADAGLRSMMIPTLWGDKPAYHDPVYEPVWSAAEANGIVINVHSGGASKDILPGPGMVPIYATEAWWWAARPLWVMLWSGVFDRHPDLKLAITEDGAWWLADIVERMDEKWVGGHNTRKFGNLFRESIQRKPSEYLGTNVFLGASTPSRYEVATRDRVGVRTLLWGNDFPHPEGTWPHTRESIHDVFHDVPVDETAQMLGLTSAEVYRFDVDKLASTVERIGPTHEEVHG